MRFETGPGEQAQVDYGQLRVWIGEQPETVHLFVFTLGYSQRLFARGYPDERLATLLDGHERAFRRFGGITLSRRYDNPRTLVLGRRENSRALATVAGFERDHRYVLRPRAGANAQTGPCRHTGACSRRYGCGSYAVIIINQVSVWR